MNLIEAKEELQPGIKQTTSVFLVDGDKVLLGMKKRGFATGKWNGFGGKREKGETIDDAAKREVREESGIIVDDLVKHAVLNCHHPAWSQQVHVYVAKEWKGTPVESEEMKPQWFSWHEVPYDQMWDDAHLLLPMILNGQKFTATLHFDDSGKLTGHGITLVEDFE